MPPPNGMFKTAAPTEDAATSDSIINRKRQVSSGLSTRFAANIGRQGALADRIHSDPRSMGQKSPRVGDLVSKLEGPPSPAPTSQSTVTDSDFGHSSFKSETFVLRRRSNTANLLPTKPTKPTKNKLTAIFDNGQDPFELDYSEYPSKRPSCFAPTPRYPPSPSSSGVSDMENCEEGHSPDIPSTPRLIVPRVRGTDTGNRAGVNESNTATTQTPRTDSGSVKAIIQKFERRAVSESPCPLPSEKSGNGRAVTPSKTSGNFMGIPSAGLANSPTTPSMATGIDKDKKGWGQLTTSSTATRTPSGTDKVSNVFPIAKNNKQSPGLSNAGKTRRANIGPATEWADFMRIGAESARIAKKKGIDVGRRRVSGGSWNTSSSKASTTHTQEANEAGEVLHEGLNLKSTESKKNGELQNEGQDYGATVEHCDEKKEGVVEANKKAERERMTSARLGYSATSASATIKAAGNHTPTPKMADRAASGFVTTANESGDPHKNLCVGEATSGDEGKTQKEALKGPCGRETGMVAGVKSQEPHTNQGKQESAAATLFKRDSKDIREY
jgi:hypothetical protein